MTDHSKPVGWWCPVCGSEGAYIGAVSVACACQTPRVPMVPVFKPLPTPEPTTWGESGGDEAVCNEPNGTGGAFYFMGFEPTLGRLVMESITGRILAKGVGTGPDSVPDLVTAIRHVAEE